MAMSLNNWKTSGRSKSVRCVYLGQTYIQKDSCEPNNRKWLNFWRRITKKKKNSGFSMQKTYDAESYMQNFDEGLGTVEPDNLYRSFSARYADPNSIFARRKDH